VKSSLVLVPRLRSRHLEEVGVGVGGLVGEGQLLATPSAAAASSRPST